MVTNVMVLFANSLANSWFADEINIVATVFTQTVAYSTQLSVGLYYGRLFRQKLQILMVNDAKWTYCARHSTILIGGQTCGVGQSNK